jgi:hypothetical protein
MESNAEQVAAYLVDENALGPDKPFGPVAAALLAAGIGSFALGLMTTLAEASTSFSDALAWSERVGALSGKTIVAVAVWLIAWAILHLLYRGKDPSHKVVYTITALLVAGGLLLTFPVFFQLFESD